MPDWIWVALIVAGVIAGVFYLRKNNMLGGGGGAGRNTGADKL